MQAARMRAEASWFEGSAATMDVSSLITTLLSPEGGALVPLVIDHAAAIVGVLTGALFACDRKLDVIGTAALGLVAGYGGGIMRDLLLQTQGIYFMSHPELVAASIVLCVFVFYFRGMFKHLDATVFFADSFSVGLFAFAGAFKALSCGQSPIIAVILGTVTAVGGGALRDICVGETPGIFLRGNFYAITGLAGAFSFVVLAVVGCPQVVAGVICIAVVMFLRYLSVYFDWKTRSEVDYTPHVKRSVRKVIGAVIAAGSARGKSRKRH